MEMVVVALAVVAKVAVVVAEEPLEGGSTAMVLLAVEVVAVVETAAHTQADQALAEATQEMAAAQQVRVQKAMVP